MKKALLLLATMFLAACGTGGGEGTQTGTLKLNMTESTAKTVELAANAPMATHARVIIKNASTAILPKPIITDVLAGSVDGLTFQLPVAGGYTVDIISYYKVGTKNRLRKHGVSGSFTIAASVNEPVPVPMIPFNPKLAFRTYETKTTYAATPSLFASATQAGITTIDSQPKAFFDVYTSGTGVVAPLRTSFGFTARTSGVFANNTTFATTENNSNLALYKQMQSPATNDAAVNKYYGRGDFYLSSDYLTDAEKVGTGYKNWVITYPYKANPPVEIFEVPVTVNGFTINPTGGTPAL